ncbi:MAG TPA: outer membrane protein assembly factor BamB [Burkholderiaceae bacterium]|nr:outer membrane protein assembly factor BamB [Burkholderiaceae bacterium]
MKFQPTAPGQRPGMRRAMCGLALLACVLAACSSSKTEKPAKLTDIPSPLSIRVTWRVKVGDGRSSYLQPAVLQNAIYAADADGDLVRIDPSDGKELWHSRVPAKLEAGVGSDGFVVAVAGQRGEVFGYSAEGLMRWQARVPSDVVTTPLVGHGLVLVRSTDQGVTAFDAEDGHKRWNFKRQTPPLALRAPSEMAFSGDSVIAGFPGGRLVAIALSNGAARWDSAVSEPKGATEVERLADVLGSIGLQDNHVCAASYQGRVACFDPTSGDQQWAREMPAGAGVAIQGEELVGIDSASIVQAFTLSSGALRWTCKLLARRGLSSPGAQERWVAVGDREGYVHFLNAGDGKLVGRVDLDGSPIVAQPRQVAGGYVVQTQRGHVVLLTPQS